MTDDTPPPPADAPADAPAPTPEAPPGELAAPKDGGKATHFIFDHKIFTLPNVKFIREPDRLEAGLSMELGEHRAFLSTAILLKMFPEMSEDDKKLIGTVVRSLAYVGEIQPGDSIPNEILDGSASWKVDPIHKDRARGRIVAALLAQDGGDLDEGLITGGLTPRLAQPGFKEKLDSEHNRLLASMGVPADQSAEYKSRFEKVAREFAYIEGLRDRYAQVSSIVDKLAKTAKTYRNSGALSEEIYRVRILIKKPVEEYHTLFQNADAQTAEIRNVARKTAEIVDFTRATRDKLHQKLLIWDSVVAGWKSEHVEGRSRRLETLIKNTYRFVAHYFPADEQWTLSH
ncbi:MAG: hypothetical protein NBV67_05635 [Tagaea sp.]|nr:hypothetical protein [Tagaea sp.]